YYILENHSQDIKQRLTTNLVYFKGDIIKSFADLYKYILDKVSEDNNKLYFKNIFLNMDYKLEKKFLPNLEDNLNEIIQLVDITSLNINSRLQLIYVLEIIEAVMMRNLVQVFQRSLSKEKDIEIFIKELLLLKEGLYNKS
ncbi:MAG: hypothetical protein PHD78_03535, partial [Bacilli bacterium]|nr:hypothetical protein [Bacilli bacterium]MDD4053847.1 hypothetical protein [Bacilli bacterium]MDD4411063.1 hypothetical protein [Bacilli bacterium]